MAKKQGTKKESAKQKDKAKENTSSKAPLGVCEKAFSPESARLEDKDEPCEDGIQR
jgi:hypothetical protein